MTVLVDTSIWIRFLANRAPVAPALDRLLLDDEVAGHEMILGELLIGDKGGRRNLLSLYAGLPWIPLVPHQDVVEFVLSRGLNGRTQGRLQNQRFGIASATREADRSPSAPGEVAGHFV